MKTTSPAEEICGILVEKIKAYDEFQSATGLLKKAFETEEMEGVNQYIKRREELIGDIDELDRRINRYWHSIRFDQRPAIVRRVARISDDLGGKLSQINSANQDCTAIAVRSCEVLWNDLTVFNQKKEGLQGYFGKTQRIPKFLSVRT
jgi:hypothetical protein